MTEIQNLRGMSANAIADVVATYARALGWDLAAKPATSLKTSGWS